MSRRVPEREHWRLEDYQWNRHSLSAAGTSPDSNPGQSAHLSPSCAVMASLIMHRSAHCFCHILKASTHINVWLQQAGSCHSQVCLFARLSSVQTTTAVSICMPCHVRLHSWPCDRKFNAGIIGSAAIRPGGMLCSIACRHRYSHGHAAVKISLTNSQCYQAGELPPQLLLQHTQLYPGMKRFVCRLRPAQVRLIWLVPEAGHVPRVRYEPPNKRSQQCPSCHGLAAAHWRPEEAHTPDLPGVRQLSRFH